MRADEDELVAEIDAVLAELVEEGHIEVVSKRSVSSLASQLRLAFEADLDLAEWLGE